MTRSGIRIAEIFIPELFEIKVRRLAAGFQERYKELDYKVDDEINNFRQYREKLRSFVIDQTPLLRSAKDKKHNILIEGANGFMLDIGTLV